MGLTVGRGGYVQAAKNSRVIDSWIVDRHLVDTLTSEAIATSLKSDMLEEPRSVAEVTGKLFPSPVLRPHHHFAPNLLAEQSLMVKE